MEIVTKMVQGTTLDYPTTILYSIHIPSKERDQPMSEPIEILSSLYTEPWWMSYDETDRDVLQDAAETIAFNLKTEWESKMAVGKALADAQRILEPHNHFTPFCQKFHFSLRTAYRRIARWKIAIANVPDVILKEAISTGMDIVGESEEQPFGPYTEAVKVIPMPRRPTPESARTWLEKVEEKRKEIRSTPEKSPPIPINNGVKIDRDAILKTSYIFLRKQLRKMPTKADTASILSRIVGMAITEFDLKLSEIKLAALEVPQDFMPQRGRPSTRRAS